MRLPLLSLISSVACLVFAGATANSEASVARAPGAISSAPAFAGAELVDVSGPASAPFSVVFFDAAGNGQEVAAGSLSRNGAAAVVTPEIGIGTAGVSFVEVHVHVGSGVDLVTRLDTLDPLFLWQ